MSLEPVILNELQLKSAETQTKIDTQTQTLVDDNATKRDEINAHSSAEAGQTIAAINSETATKLAEQTTTLQQTVTDSEAVVTQHVIQEAARVIDRNIEATDSSTTEITAHVTTEADRVIAAASGSGGGAIKVVHHLAVNLSSTDSGTTLTIPAVNRSKTFLVLNTSLGAFDNVYAFLAASTTIQIQRTGDVEVSGKKIGVVAVEVVEYA